MGNTLSNGLIYLSPLLNWCDIYLSTLPKGLFFVLFIVLFLMWYLFWLDNSILNGHTRAWSNYFQSVLWLVTSFTFTQFNFQWAQWKDKSGVQLIELIWIFLPNQKRVVLSRKLLKLPTNILDYVQMQSYFLRNFNHFQLLALY